MEILISKEELDQLSSRSPVKIKCLNCKNEFFRIKHRVQDYLRKGGLFGSFCSQTCSTEYKNKQNHINVNCKLCNNSLIRTKSDLNESNNYFCNPSCSAKYYNQFRKTEIIILKCNNCKKEFNRNKYDLNSQNINNFCSRKCVSEFQNHKKPIKTKCSNCQKEILKSSPSFNAHKYHFCNRSCQAVFANKTYNRSTRFGINKSKAETLMVAIIKKDFPDLIIIENDRKILNGLELDIYIPDKNIAIELNGPCHYIPIFGKEELSKTQNKDIIKKETMQNLKIHFFQINIMGAGNKIQQILEKSYQEQIKLLLL